MAESPIHPIDLLLKSQLAALKLAGDVVRTVRDTTVGAVDTTVGVAALPEELANQVGALAGAVAGMASAVTGIAGATAQPLQDFVVRQRELADTVHTLAEAQAELATVVAALAERHAETVAALEAVTSPIFSAIGTQPTPPKTRAARKTSQAKAAKERPTKKAATGRKKA